MYSIILSQMLVIYVCFQIYFLIDHHCKTQSELTEMLKNSPILLNSLRDVNVTGYQIASLGFSHCEIQGFYRAGKFNYFLNKMQLSTPRG